MNGYAIAICRWSLIAGRLPGRTDNEVKNYWNTHLRKKLVKMGIDPNNHRPRPVKGFAQTSDEDNSSVSQLRSEQEPRETSSTKNTSSFVPDLNLDLTIGPPLMDNR
ncbi:hypothetical protein CRG98_050190 [Punica granatum]|uniref:HTH myb-type domain-containing protein n=1 Tax=Punica granatum TaxID=22663 RepID=A0A2I0GLD4_PUNGR|nr:hypothetical protein CRG98_050190 [Punica granatum]